MELDLDNKEWQMALKLINETQRSLFLTGKAGTGKSTFLRYVTQITKKKHVVLAPTGIAAINVGGSTLHSFFRIPFHPLLPDDEQFSPKHIRKKLRYSSNHIKLIRELELIIIDEISMVRSDIIDFIDKVLRIYCHNMREPFGGKQLLLVGDIFQLEPVLKEDDRRLLQPYYHTPYFFGAKVFQDFKLASIELQKIYRQSDNQFINILDRIRNNTCTSRDLSVINTRVGAEQATADRQLVITLASRKDTVDYINDHRLAELAGSSSIFNGHISGDFPVASLPTTMDLEIKPGAQVIFIKNDMDKRWVNGTLGVVSYIDEEEGIIGVITEEGHEYDVERANWENIRYKYNENERKIEEELLGVFTQFPLRLAWAITIHKSQGLTFNKVNIDFSGGAFASGQTYVALSRCTSLEGISLNAPLHSSDIIIKPEVTAFANQYNNRGIIQQVIKESKADDKYKKAIDAFDRGDYDALLAYFFEAIHSRYDIEKPGAQRLIRRKLNKIPMLQQEIDRLHQEIARRDNYLKQLAAEYVIMGKECEKEQMYTAAIANYAKALELYPDAIDVKKRMEKLKKKL